KSGSTSSSETFHIPPTNKEDIMCEKVQKSSARSRAISVGAMMAAAVLFSAPFSSPAWAQKTIIDEWDAVKVPPAPKLEPVKVDPKETALLILDIQNNNCNSKRRPRCVVSIPKIRGLLAKARARGMAVIYSLTRSREVGDIRKEVAPRAGEPSVKASADKFYGTDLETILKGKGIRTVILVGTSAHGAVLNTAAGAAARKLKVVVPVDGMSASAPFAEQYTAWHLVKGPATRRRMSLTRTGLIRF
ncbi:cysteine hydrolase family protein, partial [Nitrospinota bacterium]